MNFSRRHLLAGAAAGASLALAPTTAHAEAEAAPGALGLLYDATACVGCQACVSACVEANHAPQSASLDAARASERGLTAQARSSVKLYTYADGSERSFVKQQCIH